MFLTVSASCLAPTDHVVVHFNTHTNTQKRDLMCIMDHLHILWLISRWFLFSKNISPYTQEDDNLQPSMQLLISDHKSKLAKPLLRSLCSIKAA